MIEDRDIERMLETWFEDEARPMPPELLESILEAVPRMGRRSRVERPIPRWSFVLAAAGVLIVVVVAWPQLAATLGPALEGFVGGLGRASPSPTVMVSPTAMASPSAVPTSSPMPIAIATVSGSGDRLDAGGEPIVEFSLDARMGPTGVSGTYHFRQLLSGAGFEGQVTCLLVSGSTASVGGRITAVTAPGDPSVVGDAFLVFLLDRGDPLGGNPGPDVVSQTYILPGDAVNVTVPDDFPVTCPDPLTTVHDSYDVTGNVVVTER